ncbi:MAG: fibronectin type III domain-containing protein, partial [Deltaproteobacteria bacterium]|nr:fibronectin type III domain-containing protein [Deltaproteobacteria bacterium]
MTRGNTILSLLFAFFLLSLPACGKKAPPVPLGVLEPARVGDLTAYAKDGSIYLGWTVPTTNADGSRLEDLVGFRVFRREREVPFFPCVQCSEKFETVAEIDVDYPRGAQVVAEKVLWQDPTLQRKREYVYFVVAYNGDHYPSPESNR